MTIPKDYSNQRYGKLTTIKEVEPYIPPSGSYKKRQYLCKCDCGNVITAQITAIRSGNTRSCSCAQSEHITNLNKERSIYDGYSQHRHFKRWKGMIERCYYEKHKDYHNYGGRGISVCDEWREHPKHFIEWIENESNYKKGLTLDRIDVNGNYEPNNCTFSTPTEQALNKNIPSNNTSGYVGVSRHGKDRWVARITVNGERKSLGVYDLLEDAAKAREEAEIKYYGRTLYK